jgi:Methyltransferase domain
MDTLKYLCERFHISPNSTSPIDIPFEKREVLGVLFAELGFKDGAEIGVSTGKFSKHLCSCNKKLNLLAVDAWKLYLGYEDDLGRKTPITQELLEQHYERAKERLARYKRCKIIRMFSKDAAATLKDNSLDFVYLDANHSVAEVMEDLIAWTPKVRPGGIICGHDYTPVAHGYTGGAGVVKAVNLYTSVHEIKPWFVLDENFLWIKE